MDDLNARLGKLGKEVSETSDRLADPAVLAAARRRWLHAPPRAAASSRRRPALLIALSTCVACALLVWLFHVRRESPGITFATGTPPVQGAVGDWIAASGEAPLPMRFSEGSRVTLAPGTRARVTETGAHGASVLLERGRVSATVVHAGPETRWALRAGPFEVRVTGTSFDAAWDPAGETFEIVMREGSVLVRGPMLLEGRAIVSGEQMRVSVRERAMDLRTTRAEAAPAVAPPSAEPAPAAVPSSPAREDAASRATPAAPGAPSSAAPSSAAPSSAALTARGASEPGWRDLAAAGKYKDALAAAERGNFAQELERASEGDLTALSDAARYGARPDLAREALLAQRRRFGARGRSAFMLGKIAADQQGSAAEAIRWFETYLVEEPSGALREQALGRLLELKKGEPASARATAERYLATYPNGAYAALARSLLTP